MLHDKKISVLITTYHPERAKTIYTVIEKWLLQPIDELWLLDNSGYVQEEILKKTVMQDKRFLYWLMPKDFHTRADYGVALLTDGDIIWCADDDLYPLEGFVETFMDFQKEHDFDVFAGVIGRVFECDEYRGCPFFASNKIPQPVETGFSGVCYCAPRKYFGFDTRGMERNMDDLWHQMKCFPEARKFVVPTRAYRNMPCSNDKSAMFKGTPQLKASRYDFFREMWHKNYADRAGAKP